MSTHEEPLWLTQVDLDALEKARNAASLAQWKRTEKWVLNPEGDSACGNWMMAQCQWPEIAEYIATAHNQMPAIIAELRALRELLGCATRFQVGRCTVLLTGGGFWWRLIAPGYEDLFDSSYKALAAARQWDEARERSAEIEDEKDEWNKD